MEYLTGLIFIAAALLEVGGDALIRKGLVNSNLLLIVSGCLALGGYGLLTKYLHSAERSNCVFNVTF
jgi:small multidrug resistance family-3 protein